MLNIQLEDEGRIILVRATGKITREDYTLFQPEIERHIALHGKVRILFEMHEFHGWSPSAVWQDIKFDFKHFNDIERIAILGEKRWHKVMAGICRPFTTAKIRYFDTMQWPEAHEWITERVPEEALR